MISQSNILQMPPKAFNRIKSGTVRWQPENDQPMLKQAEGRLDSATVMVRGIVHNQDQRGRRILMNQQMLQKGDESIAVLNCCHLPTDRPCLPIKCAYHMLKPLRPTTGGQAPLLPPFHPTLSYRKVQAHGCFVHKEKLEITICGLFFKSAKRASASLRASAFCSVRKSGLGRR